MGLRTDTLTARWIIPVDRPPLAHGVITVHDGRIVAVEPHRRAAGATDLGHCALLPGQVNAHTHLDLTGLRGRVAPGADFVAWLRAVVQHRRSRTPEAVQNDIRNGIAESIAHGTTLLGDISACGASWQALSESNLRAVVFHELLGLPRDRARDAWQAVTNWIEQHPPTPTCRPGLSPHAPYSVRRSLMDLAVREARDNFRPLAIHVAETRAEQELLEHHRGPFVDFLTELGVWDPEGLLPSFDEVIALCRQARTALLIHANYLRPQQLAPGATVVYCPRTHAAFGHEPYPLAEFRATGARIALGTDSLASNPDLSVLEEARFVHRHFPALPPHEVLRMATLNGAEALGWSEITGSLTPGKAADMVIVPLPEEMGDPCEQVLVGKTSAQSWSGERGA
jgi:cytosine/adenosine deaminase-related metal-dependent hydrolase